MKTNNFPYRLLVLLPLFFLSFSTFSQNISNGGFEEWSEDNEETQPLYWSTSNYPEEDTPSVLRSGDACNESYSLVVRSTAPGWEGPGSGRAEQRIVLEESLSEVFLQFNYAADTLEEGTYGKIALSAFQIIGNDTLGLDYQSMEITELTDGCVPGSLSLTTSEPFDVLDVKLEAFPLGTSTGNEGLAVLRFDDLELTTSISIDESEVPDKIKVSPNPTNGKIRISTKAPVQNIVLLNNTGKVISEFKSEQRVLDLSHIPSGMYFLRVLSEDSVSTTKVIKR